MAAPQWPSKWIWQFSVSFTGDMKNWQGYGYWYNDWTTNSWRMDEMLRVDLPVPGIPEPFPFMTTWSAPDANVRSALCWYVFVADVYV